MIPPNKEPQQRLNKDWRVLVLTCRDPVSPAEVRVQVQMHENKHILLFCRLGDEHTKSIATECPLM